MTPAQVAQVSIEYEVTYTYGYSGYRYDGQPSDETNCYATFIVTSKEIPSGRSPYRNYVNYKKGEKSCKEEAGLHIEPLIPSMKLSLHRYAISYHEEKLKKLTNRRGQERYIKSALALFDSIPILKKIPVIKEANFDDLYKALDILTSLHTTLPKDTRIWNNVFQQVGLLGGYLVTYSIKDAIDLEGVKSPYDLICKVNASKLISNYRHLLTGSKALLNVTLESDFYEKNKVNMDKALDYIKLAPESISDEQKEEFIDNIMDFQEDNC
jgi:hypothetical protein